MSKRDPAISRLVTELLAASDRMTRQQKKLRDAHVASVFPPDIEQLINELISLPASGIARERNAIMRQAVKAGFVLAMARYSRELKMNAEALALINARQQGGAIGREAATRKKEQRYAKIRERWAAMEAAGQTPTNQAVAQAVGCGVSTVIRAFKSKPAKRPKR
jgi:DNA invertase Pin-like site-specific DNA recombinase